MRTGEACSGLLAVRDSLLVDVTAIASPRLAPPDAVKVLRVFASSRLHFHMSGNVGIEIINTPALGTRASRRRGSLPQQGMNGMRIGTRREYAS